MNDYTEITIRRDSGYADRFRSYRIMIDGEERGEIGNGETVTIRIEPGRHRLSLKIDWCGSPTVEFDASPGKHLFFDCGSGVRGMWGIEILKRLIFRPDDYLWIKPSVTR